MQQGQRRSEDPLMKDTQPKNEASNLRLLLLQLYHNLEDHVPLLIALTIHTEDKNPKDKNVAQTVFAAGHPRNY